MSFTTTALTSLRVHKQSASWYVAIFRINCRGHPARCCLPNWTIRLGLGTHPYRNPYATKCYTRPRFWHNVWGTELVSSDILRASDGLLWTRYWTVGFHSRLGDSWLSGRQSLTKNPVESPSNTWQHVDFTYCYSSLRFRLDWNSAISMKWLLCPK
jgi:hypothetical protein